MAKSEQLFLIKESTLKELIQGFVNMQTLEDRGVRDWEWCDRFDLEILKPGEEHESPHFYKTDPGADSLGQCHIYLTDFAEPLGEKHGELLLDFGEPALKASPSIYPIKEGFYHVCLEEYASPVD